MSSNTVNARIDPKTKEEATAILNSLGLKMTDAISMFLRQIIYTKGIPFEVKLPGKETLKAIDELESGAGATFATVDDLFKDLEN